MTRLFLTNIPCDCQDAELRGWIESRGFDVDSMRVVRDDVSGVSPAFGYVSVRPVGEPSDAVTILDGQPLKGRRVQVKQDWRK